MAMPEAPAGVQTWRCVVSGRVQGVGFRAATRRRAVALGLQGHARNLPDGRVEVLARGPEHALRQLRDWLREGPSAAQVRDVLCDVVPDGTGEGFVVR